MEQQTQHVQDSEIVSLKDAPAGPETEVLNCAVELLTQGTHEVRDPFDVLALWNLAQEAVELTGNEDSPAFCEQDGSDAERARIKKVYLRMAIGAYRTFLNTMLDCVLADPQEYIANWDGPSDEPFCEF